MPSQPGGSDLGNRLITAAAGLFGGEILLRLVLEAPPAEQVKFIGTYAKFDTILVEIFLQARAGKVLGNLLEVGFGAGIDPRQEFSAPNLVLGAGPFDIEDGNTQVTVVLQRQGDQLLQLRIDKEFLPRDLGQRLR
jgi:hypothetical protein